MKLQPIKPDKSSEKSFSDDTDFSGQIHTKFKPPKRLSQKIDLVTNQIKQNETENQYKFNQSQNTFS